MSKTTLIQSSSSFPELDVEGMTEIYTVCKSKYEYSSIAQSVEHAAVNRGVVGSSPTGGAKKRQVERLAVFLLHNLRCSAYYRYGSYDYSNSFAINSSVLIRPSRL